MPAGGLTHVWPGAVLAPGLIGLDRTGTGCRTARRLGALISQRCSEVGRLTDASRVGACSCGDGRHRECPPLARIKVSLLTTTMRS